MRTTTTLIRPQGYSFFSCSKPSMKVSLLIDMKMPTIGGIFIFIIREFFLCAATFSKKEFAVVSNLRFISRTHFMLS